MIVVFCVLFCELMFGDFFGVVFVMYVEINYGDSYVFVNVDGV